MKEAVETIKSMAFWQGPVSPEPLSGGLTNLNYLVSDGPAKYVVRLGSDIVEHQLMRFNELAASRAAHAAGISPQVRHAEPGIMVLDYIQSKTFTPQDVRQAHNLERILSLLKTCHREVPRFLRGASLIFWVFHVLRDYGWTLREKESVYTAQLDALQAKADVLERASGPHDLVFGHNDLLAANILDDGTRLWLVDWDYAGFNSPLFDLGGLASNNEFDEVQEKWLLENYFEKSADDELLHRYQAMKCASLLRETMWSMVSEIHSTIEFDYRRYTGENLARFEKAYDEFIRSQN